MNIPSFSSVAFVITVVFLNAGCDQNAKPAAAVQTTVKRFSKPVQLEGTVSSGRSLIKSGMVEASDEIGKKIAETAVNEGQFKIEIPSGSPLPLVLTFTSESRSDKLTSVVVSEHITKYFIDPSTTSIAKAAKAMGGYTHANMVRAAEDTTSVPDANKTTSGWRGDPTTQYGGWH